MDLSVVVVTWSSEAEIETCLASLGPRLDGRLAYEILVVDNDSPDATVAAVRRARPDAKLIETGANEGFGRAANRGMALARGRFVLLLNPDCEVGAGLPELVGWLDGHPEVGIATGWVLGSDGRVQRNWGRRPPSLWTEILEHTTLARLLPRLFGRHWLGAFDQPVLRDVPAVSGMAMIVRRDLARELGGFDPAFFMYCEDFDLCCRARARGVRIVRNPVATFVHHGGRSAARVDDGSLARTWPYTSMYLFLRKHRGASQARAFRWLVRAGLRLRLALTGVTRLLGGRCAGSEAKREEYRRILRRLASPAAWTASATAPDGGTA